MLAAWVSSVTMNRVLDDFQLEAYKERREDPAPAELVPHWVTVRDPPHDLIQQRRPKDDLPMAYAKTRAGVEGSFVFCRETVESEVAEELAMSRIRKGVSGRKVRNGYPHHRSVTAHPVNLFEGGNDAVEVFNDIVGDHFTEVVVGERPRQLIEIMDDIRICPRRNIYINSMRQMLGAATQIQRFVA